MGLLKQRVNHGAHIQALQVGVLLACAHEDDWLPRFVHHGEGGANLVVNGVELGEHDAVDHARIAQRAVVNQTPAV